MAPKRKSFDKGKEPWVLEDCDRIRFVSLEAKKKIEKATKKIYYGKRY